MEKLTELVELINAIVWGPWTLALILFVGISFTVKLKFFQITKFGVWFKYTFGSIFKREKSEDESISAFQAFTTALSSSVGIGNLVGVTTALLSGGPGAIFWMWFSAIFGMMTKYVEIVLSIYFRKKTPNGQYMGGPMYYINSQQKGHKSFYGFLAMLFSAAGALSAITGGNMTQINSIVTLTDAIFTEVGIIRTGTNSNYLLIRFLMGVILSLILWKIIQGGIKKIGKTTEKLMPIVIGLLLIMCIVILGYHVKEIIPAFKLIFFSAFNIKSASSGVLGYKILEASRYGICRGIFSNEAGQGSTAIAYASTKTDNPPKEALWGIAEVFLDTILISTIVALVVLTSGFYNGLNTQFDAVQLISKCFTQHFGIIGSLVLAVAIFLLGYTTTFSWYFYGKICFEFFTKGKYIKQFAVLFCFCAAISSIMNVPIVWELSDIFNALMVIPNLIGILGLVPEMIRSSKINPRRDY